MTGLFDIIGFIHSKNSYPNDEEMKEYSSYMGNRAMSQFQELIFHAEEMNERWNMPKEANFAFYYHSVPKKKRYSKWASKNNEIQGKIDIIKEYYENLSTIRCRELIPLIDDLNLWDKMTQELQKGGMIARKKSSPKKNK